MEITRTTEVITPEVAKLYLEKNIDNRKPSSNRVTFYAREMREGRWQYNGDAIRFDSDGKLRDGQHRLMACVRTNIPMKCDVIRNLPPECFVTVDQGKGRTASDFFEMDKIPNASIVSSIIQKYCKLRATGKAVIAQYGGREKFVSVKELKDIYWKDEDEYQNIANMAGRFANTTGLFQKTTIGAYIAFLHFEKLYELDYISGFFSMLFHYKTDKRSVLCELFNDLDHKSEKLHTPLTAQQKQNLLIICWNDYVNGCKGKRLPPKTKFDELQEFL